jgi:hypothetical protein
MKTTKINNPQEYEASRLQRATQLRNEIPNGPNEIRVVSTPPTLVRAGQEYLRRQRENVSVENTRCPPLRVD